MGQTIPPRARQRPEVGHRPELRYPGGEEGGGANPDAGIWGGIAQGVEPREPTWGLVIGSWSFKSNQIKIRSSAHVNGCRPLLTGSFSFCAGFFKSGSVSAMNGCPNLFGLGWEGILSRLLRVCHDSNRAGAHSLQLILEKDLWGEEPGKN